MRYHTLMDNTTISLSTSNEPSISPLSSQDETSAPSQQITGQSKPSSHVIIMHASVGSGHRSAANAINQAFELIMQEARETPSDQRDLSTQSIPDNLTTEVLDILDFGRIVFDGNAAASLFTGITRPIYDLTWRFTFTGRLLWGGGTAWSYGMYSAFTQYVKQKDPLAIVCTHITAANAAVAARMITGKTFPIICVPTDYETEGFWPHASSDLFCVANESMAETLRPRKVSEDRIMITGIPTRDDFRHDFDSVATRNQFDLPQDKLVVLALAGAYLPRPYVHFRTALDTLMPYLHSLDSSLHLVCVAGSDTEYALHLRRNCEELGLTNITILEYVDDMAALMAASDVIICKSGGLTVTECLCAKVPMILLGQAYGQEKANVRMLTSLGAALHVTTARELISALRHIAKNPECTKAMLLNGDFLRRPNAARDIAKTTLQLAAKEKDLCDPRYQKHFLNFYWGKKPAHTR